MKTVDKSIICLNVHFPACSGERGQTPAVSDDLAELNPGQPAYPPRLGAQGPVLYARGALDLLHRRRVAIFASVKTTGASILRALAWARGWSSDDGVVISGFHSPLEQECLALLLKRGMPVIVCPAREIGTYRLPQAWRAPLQGGGLLVLSQFTAHRRVSTATCAARNALVARCADEVVVLHAHGGGQIEHLVHDASKAGKPVAYLANDQHARSRR